jgi:hypothetical protein
MPLTGDKLNHIKIRRSDFAAPTIAASVTIFEHAMVALDTSGNARPARATATDRVVGVAKKRYTNLSGSAVAMPVEIDCENIHVFNNSADGDAIAIDDINKPCYVVDDQTVALTDDTGARPVAGRVAFVDAKGVYVDFKRAIAAG